MTYDKLCYYGKTSINLCRPLPVGEKHNLHNNIYLMQHSNHASQNKLQQ